MPMPSTETKHARRTPARLALAACRCCSCSACSLASARRTPRPPGSRRSPPNIPNFVVIQTDDQTLDSLYAAFRAYEGAPATRAMPNTTRPDRQTRHDLQPLLRLLSALLPLAGQPADRPLRPQPQRQGQRPAQRRLSPASPRAAAFTHNLAVWLQRPATRRSTSASSSTATATSPTTTARWCPPAGAPGTPSLNADSTHYFYGYTLNNNGAIDGPYGDSGSWDTREYGVRDDPGCPFAPTNGLPCYYQTDTADRDRDQRTPRRPRPNSPSTCSSTTPPRTATSAGRPGPSRRRASTTGSRARASRTTARKASTRATSPTSRASSAKRPPDLDDKHTYRVYWQKQLEALRGVDDGVRQIVDTARRRGPPRATPTSSSPPTTASSSASTA